ncbi:hypothetical protein DRN85_08090 [Methanosarcinales archaeon]|nr:MAG: hypothetical protein DRN85_08090 [Methanosarcinales archaeon]
MENKTTKKLFLVILVSFFILASIGSVKAASCIDSDNGINYYVKGTVISSTGRRFTDSCIDTTTVKEWVCGSDDKAWYYSYSRYGYICEGGKLIKNTGTCTETDNGKDYYNKGTSTSSTGKVFTDYCTSATTVKEYYCWTDQLVYKTEYSRTGYICKDGRLVLNTGKCTETDGGRYDYYNKGTCVSSTGAVRTDYCVDSTTVKEFFCWSDQLVYNELKSKSGYICHDGKLIEESEVSFCMDYEYQCREHYFCPLGHKCIENDVTYCNIPCQRICANNHADPRTMDKYRIIWCREDKECPCQEKVEGDYGCFSPGESCYGALKDCYCPDECEPGKTETKQCGETDVGECSYGTQKRTCTSNHKWGEWGGCIGAVYPNPEICDDGKDNDCDGLIDGDDPDCKDQEFTIIVHKIVCDNEEDLPNWGEGGPSITSTTAQDFVDAHPECEFEQGWEFQWAYSEIPNPGDNTGEASLSDGWHTFGLTDSNGKTSVVIQNPSSSPKFWVREVFQEGYVEFDKQSDVGAELYCHEDVLNYDNYDYVKNPEAEGTYYCVAFNVLEETWECETDDDCDYLDTDYCDGDSIKHNEGVCVNYECVNETTTTQNCNDLDEDYCEGTWIKNKDYTCEGAECILSSDSEIMNCDNGLFCDGQETCEDAQCFPGTPIDCSDYNIAGVATCDYCDSNSFTWDYRAEFISTCDEETDSCTEGDETVTHECSVDNCEAECDATNPCADTECDNLDGCVGNDYYDYDDMFNDCLGDCTCEQNCCSDYDISYNDSRCFNCTPGEEETISCYEGPEGTEGIGICTAGTKTRTCSSEGQWGLYGECTGAVYPAEEICDGLDNDCDGEVDEGGVCDICVPGEQQTRLCGETDVGECSYGAQTRTCVCGQYWTDWSECEGAVYPATEICDGLDNDCDGLTDEDGVCDTPLPDMNSVLGMTRFSIINDDYLRPGDNIMILVTLENNGNTNLNGIQLTFVVPELGMRRRIGPFDLKKNKEITRLIILDIPYWAKPSYYNIRATASNGDVRRVKHREILIHN